MLFRARLFGLLALLSLAWIENELTALFARRIPPDELSDEDRK